MKQTEQYGLNQWELSDRIRMEDFNADNAKIADALGGHEGRVKALEKKGFLLNYITRNNAAYNYYSIGILREDWNLYGRVHFVLDLYTTEACTMELFAGHADCGTLDVPASDAPRRTRIHFTFFPMYDETAPAYVQILTEQYNTFKMLEIPYSQVDDVGARAGKLRILPGSSIHVYTEI